MSKQIHILTTSPSQHKKSIVIPILNTSPDKQTDVDEEKQHQINNEDVVVPEVG